MARVLIGAHVSSAGGLDSAVARAVDLGVEAAQLFTQSPRMWRQTTHSPQSLERFRLRRREADLSAVVCHAIYLINLASPDDALSTRSVDALVRTVEIAAEIEAEAVVLHVGSHLGAGLDAVMGQIVAGLERGLGACEGGTHILLENSAGAGGTVGRSLDELARIDAAVGSPEELGLCLDTCHLWVSGVDVTSPTVVDALVAEVDETFGLARLECLHVNDARDAIGSNRDRHGNLGRGKIGEELAVFLAHPSFANLPAILETPGTKGRGPDAGEVAKLRAMAPPPVAG
ncbi:MAG: deoxyribonuclease IV [Gaiellales bacterium]